MELAAGSAPSLSSFILRNTLSSSPLVLKYPPFFPSKNKRSCVSCNSTANFSHCTSSDAS